MKWELLEPTYGDIVRTKVSLLFHYGIFLSNKEVIQFGKNPKDKEYFLNNQIEVISTNIDDFSFGESIEVLSFDDSDISLIHSRVQVASIAKSRLKEKGYNFYYNNCEHFVYQCLYVNPDFAKIAPNCGKLVPNFPSKVYVSNYPFIVNDVEIFPEIREKEIDNCSNEKTKKEKYYVWKLLEFALKDGFNLDIKNLNFKKEENGKWTCDKISFSLSHSGDLAAVIVSKLPYGVDIQKVEDRDNTLLMDKILNEYEKKCLPYVRKNGFYKTFAIKEANYKASNDDGFIPRLYNSLVNSMTKVIRHNNNGYVLAIAGPNIDKVEIKLLNDLVDIF